MPTIKQKKAFKEVGVNGGNISQAMKTAGYSEEVSKRTDKLTNTRGWAELMEEYLPDGELAKKHKKFLNSEREEIGLKALDLSYKLKGSYAPDKNININMNVKSIDPTDETILSSLKVIQEKLENE